MPDLIIKPEATSGNKLILKDQAGGAVLTPADSGAEINNATNITASGNVTVAGDLVPATPLSNRNVIINGGFDVWQRGTTFTSPASTDFTADRWAYLENGTMTHTITRSTDVPTQAQSGYKSNYSMKIDCTTADSSIASDVYNFVVQKIEGYNIQPLQGNTVTLSFWIKSTKTGTQTICWRNSSLDMNMVKEYTINTTNTWEKKEITWTFDNSGGTWNYTNGIGGWLCWNLAHGTNFHTTKDAWQSTSGVMSTSSAVNNTDSTSNDIYLAQVQLELGSSATPFEHRSYADELLRCQRYYTEHDAGSYVLAYLNPIKGSTGASDEYRRYMFYYPIRMRANPSVTATGDPGSISINNPANKEYAHCAGDQGGDEGTVVNLRTVKADAEL